MKRSLEIDRLSVERANTAHPSLRDELLAILVACANRGVRVRFTWVKRTEAQQDAIFAQGRTAPGPIVTWAKGDESIHVWGLAVDICLMLNDREVSWNTMADLDHDGERDWMEIATEFLNRGWEWGGSWPKPKTDRAHFQKTYGLTIQELRVMKQLGAVDDDGYIRYRGVANCQR